MISPTDIRERLIHIGREHFLFIMIMIGGALIWGLVFWRAAMSFAGTAPFRGVWNGSGALPIFGYTVNFNFEGWVDYDYYYVDWADQFLRGLAPYTDQFNQVTFGSETYQTPYFFPPLYLYLCVIGRLLPIQPYGIGLLLTIFGYLTAIPIYGMARYLSDQPLVGVIAALGYLFNPMVLYYTAYQWLNPAPFVFFSMLGFYLLMRNHRIGGAFAIVTAVFFKQIAMFFGLPLLVVLLKRAPDPASADLPDGERPPGDAIDGKGFLRIVAIIIVYALVLSMPYILEPSNYLYYIFVRPGITKLEDLTVPSEFTLPVTMVIPFIVFNAPMWLRAFIDFITYSALAMIIGMGIFLVLMLIEVKDDCNLREYWRRLFYLMFLLLLWIHIWSPRGIYKYYLVAIIPFLSILSLSRMCSIQTGPVRVSLLMIVVPLLWSLVILFAPRNLYILILCGMFAAYLLHRHIAMIWTRLTRVVYTRIPRLRSTSTP
ncbi:MAG: hypothetical protein K9W43_01880 [Candidatus Thorarchaeota archaeon]|nr:hypothetical protein [Candidatus Thorarchaeota archaeon]